MAIRLAWDLLAAFERGAHGPGDLAEACRALIDDEGLVHLRVADLADLLAVDRSTLFRAFRLRFDGSLKHYLDLARLRQAEALLRHTRDEVAQIARSVGYSDAGWFARRFAAVYGTTPARYRRAC
ncbi:MAG: helix-turn-helix transcriptional regulator [Planctomycetota bacterium]|nr:helix-turn-helix transcriptional regulator [Planctomycetota bacterium]